MWQLILANFLVVVACSIGVWANVRLCYKLFKGTPYIKYIQWHTVGKGLSNVLTLFVFSIIEIPTIFMNRTVYPEIVYRLGGGLAGLGTLPGRINQLCLSCGTCYIAFFPFKPIPNSVLYSSIILSILTGLTVFSIRITSESCSFEFRVTSFAWNYSAGYCGQILKDVIFYGAKFQIFSGYFFNFLTFAKICLDTKRKTFIGNNELANRLRKTKIRLAQCVIQDFLFLTDVTVQFGIDFGQQNSSYQIGFFLPFLFNTVCWNLAHGIDGFITLITLSEAKNITFRYSLTPSHIP